MGYLIFNHSSPPFSNEFQINSCTADLKVLSGKEDEEAHVKMLKTRKPLPARLWRYSVLSLGWDFQRSTWGWVAEVTGFLWRLQLSVLRGSRLLTCLTCQVFWATFNHLMPVLTDFFLLVGWKNPRGSWLEQRTAPVSFFMLLKQSPHLSVRHQEKKGYFPSLNLLWYNSEC